MSASSKKKLRKEINEQKITERQKQERAEAKQIKRLTFAFVAVIVIVLGIFIAGRAFDHVAKYGLVEKNTIAVTIGDHKLDTVTMNYFFRDGIDSLYNTYYQYFGDSASSYLGFDLTQPLSDQVYNEEAGTTWGDYFLDEAIESARAIYTMYDEAIANGYMLSDDEKASISSTLSTMDLYAQPYGYSSTDQYLRAIYGNGSSRSSYENYLTVQSTASAYYSYYETTLVYNDADIRAYDTEHPNEYDSFDYNYYYLKNTSFLTGGTTDEEGNTTYSDEENEAARAAAEAAANSLLTATNVEELDTAIAALEINLESTTAHSTASSDIAYSSLTALFKDWLIEDGRQENDITVITNTTSSTDEEGNTTETVSGYYVVMFGARNDNTSKMGDIRQVFISCEGGTTDDDGNTTYSDEEIAAAHTKAEELLQAWKDGEATSETFITLVDDNGGSDGGLVENINKSSSYDYASWALAEGRTAGDTGIIDTDTGCYIVYYQGDSTLNYRDYRIETDMRAEDYSSWETGITEAVEPVKGNTSKVRTWLVYSAS